MIKKVIPPPTAWLSHLKKMPLGHPPHNIHIDTMRLSQHATAGQVVGITDKGQDTGYRYVISGIALRPFQKIAVMHLIVIKEDKND